MQVDALGKAVTGKTVSRQSGAQLTTKEGFAQVLAAEQQRSPEQEKLRKACQEFEAIFLYQLMQGMRRTIPQSGLTGKGMGREIFESLFDQEVTKQMAASNNNTGLAGLLYEQLSKYLDADRSE